MSIILLEARSFPLKQNKWLGVIKINDISFTFKVYGRIQLTSYNTVKELRKKTNMIDVILDSFWICSKEILKLL